MKIAVSSQDKTHVTAHLGHCQKFWLYDVDEAVIHDKQLLQLDKAQSFHESSPKASHPLDIVQVLISGSMGNGLARRLESKGIQAIITPETDPDTAVNAYLAGSLIKVSPEEHAHHHHSDTEAHTHECSCHLQ